MNKTKIEWCDYAINPVKGLCPVACPYCYARRMYKRFKWNPEIRFESSVMGYSAMSYITKPSRIFIGSTMELFGKWIKPEWIKFILHMCSVYKEHTFIFLSKCLNGLKQWEFPDNCIVGLSAPTIGYYEFEDLSQVNAKTKVVSFEPMLDYTPPDLRYVNWIIIGSQTQPVKHPPLWQVESLIKYADEAHIPVFVKEPMASYYGIQRKEFPSER